MYIKLEGLTYSKLEERRRSWASLIKKEILQSFRCFRLVRKDVCLESGYIVYIATNIVCNRNMLSCIFSNLHRELVIIGERKSFSSVSHSWHKLRDSKQLNLLFFPPLLCIVEKTSLMQAHFDIKYKSKLQLFAYVQFICELGQYLWSRIMTHFVQ